MDEATIRRFIDSFDDPEGFTGPSTAVVEQLPRLLRVANAEPAAWHTVAVEALTAHVLGQAGAPLAAALIQADRACRVYDQDDCEELDWFVARLRDEAAAVPRPRLAVVAPDATAHGAAFARYETLNQAQPPHVRRLVAYSETRSPAAATAMTASVSLSPTPAPGSALRPVLPDQAGLLGRILRGHPARRRYRLSQPPGAPGRA